MDFDFVGRNKHIKKLTEKIADIRISVENQYSTFTQNYSMEFRVFGMLVLILVLTTITYTFYMLLLSEIQKIQYSVLKTRSVTNDLLSLGLWASYTFFFFTLTWMIIISAFKNVFKPAEEKLIQIRKWENNYLIATFFISFLLVGFGYQTYVSIYASTFPLEGVNPDPALYSGGSAYGLFRNYTCISEEGLLYPVSHKRIICDQTLQNPSPDNLILNRINAIYFTQDTTQKYSDNKTTLGSGRLTESNLSANSTSQLHKLNVLLGEPGVYYYGIILDYTINGSEREERIDGGYITVLSLEEYNKRDNERFTMILAIISISIFSVASTVKTIKEIVENK